MKRKRQKIPKQRNPYVAQARFRVAGAHDKPYKSKRKREKQNFTEFIRTGAREADGDRLLICSSNANVGSNPTRFTIISMIRLCFCWGAKVPWLGERAYLPNNAPVAQWSRAGSS